MLIWGAISPVFVFVFTFTYRSFAPQIQADLFIVQPV